MKIKSGVQLPCACGGTVRAGVLEGGESFIEHTEPPCPAFIELEPDEFLRIQRLRLEKEPVA